MTVDDLRQRSNIYRDMIYLGWRPYAPKDRVTRCEQCGEQACYQHGERFLCEMHAKETQTFIDRLLGPRATDDWWLD